MTRSTILATTLMVSLGLGLAGCGTTKTERALSGAGIGAAVGVTGAAITGGNKLTGAIVGGAAGAATGALTDKKQIDLGD